MEDQKNQSNSKLPEFHYEHTKVWISDFGSHELEEELVENVLKLKPAGGKNPSWIFSSMAIVILIVAVEILIRQWAHGQYWSEMNIFLLVWLARIILLLFWIYIAGARLLLRPDKLLVITLIGFTLGVIASAVIKIWLVQSTWAFLNFLVEPIWMLLISGLSVSVFLKLKNKK